MEDSEENIYIDIRAEKVNKILTTKLVILSPGSYMLADFLMAPTASLAALTDLIKLFF